MSKENRVLTVRLDEGLHRRARVKIAQEGVSSFQQLIVALLEGWLHGGVEAESPKPSAGDTQTPTGEPTRGGIVLEPGDAKEWYAKQHPEYEQYYRKFDRVIRSGNLVAIEALTKNVNAFDVLVSALSDVPDALDDDNQLPSLEEIKRTLPGLAGAYAEYLAYKSGTTEGTGGTKVRSRKKRAS